MELDRPSNLSLAALSAAHDKTAAALVSGADVVYLCLNAPYDRWAHDLPPLQEAVLAGAEAASSKVVVLENLYMYGPHDGPLTESLPHAATADHRKASPRWSRWRQP